MGIENIINKQKKKIKKELISFVKFIVPYIFIVTVITLLFISALETAISLTTENTHTVTGQLDSWQIIDKYSIKSRSKAYFVIDGQQYKCLTNHYAPKERWEEICVGDTVTVTVYNNEKPDWSGRITISGFERNGEVYFDIDDADKGNGFVKFCVVPGFIIVEIIAGVVLIARIAMFVYTICKYSSKLQKYKDKQHVD